MAWNGSGTYTQEDGTRSGSGMAAAWRDDGDATIEATDFDNLLEDHATAINACLAKNGENAATGNLDIGGFRLTNLGTSTSSTDAGTHGKDVASGSYNAGSDRIELLLQDGTQLNIDTSGISAGTNGVALTGDQTVAGIKTFSDETVLAEVKHSGPDKHVVGVPTPGASVTVDATAASSHWVTVAVNTDVTMTLPSFATDADLGANWSIKGEITFYHTVAAKTITINSTLLASFTDSSVEGTNSTGLNDFNTLTYNIKYIAGSTYAQFAWVSTP